jgi:hypothetical protein
MPFELGLTVAMAMSKNNAHHWIVLEEANYRIQQSLSDLNGYDPYVHRGTIKGVFAALLNAFEKPGYTPTIPTMTEVYRALQYCGVTRER